MLTFSPEKRLAYWRLMRADKPIGIYLLLWPTLWALVIAAQGMPPWPILLVFVLGVVVMRSAGCVINDYADRHVDGHVERTQARPLASGEVTEKEAIQLFVILIGMAFALVLSLNKETILLSLIALLLAAVYPFMKRYTHFPQVVLGAAFGWAIPMASMAVTTILPPWVWMVFLANLCWTVSYDTFYAMVDRDDDLKIGVKSTAIAFGRFDMVAIIALQAMTIGLLWLAFDTVELNGFAFAGLTIAAMGFILIDWQARHKTRDSLFQAFLRNHYVGLLILLGIVVGVV